MSLIHIFSVRERPLVGIEKKVTHFKRKMLNCWKLEIYSIGVTDKILIINAHNLIFSKATGYDRVGGFKVRWKSQPVFENGNIVCHLLSILKPRVGNFCKKKKKKRLKEKFYILPSRIPYVISWNLRTDHLQTNEVNVFFRGFLQLENGASNLIFLLIFFFFSKIQFCTYYYQRYKMDEIC